MHVALTCNFSPWSPYSGGGQRSTHALASALCRLGVEVSVIYTKSLLEEIEPTTPPPYRLIWAPFIGLRSRRQAPLRPANAAPVAWALRELHAASPISVVHGQGEECALAPTALPDTPLVVTPRYPDYPDRLKSHRRGLARASVWLTDPKYLVLGEALRQADLICPTSHAARRLVEQAFGLPTDRMVVVPNGIEASFLDAAPVDPQAHTDGAIVYFGRFSAEKGPDTLVEAWGRLPVDTRPRLVLCGRGELLAPLRERADALGGAEQVTLRGWCEPPIMVRELRRARAAVIPSREESFGNTAAEAMAVGAPVVLSRAGSLPEVVGDDSLALWFEPGDAGGLARALAALLADPVAAAERAARARAAIARRFRWDSVAERFLECYAEARRRHVRAP